MAAVLQPSPFPPEKPSSLFVTDKIEPGLSSASSATSATVDPSERTDSVASLDDSRGNKHSTMGSTSTLYSKVAAEGIEHSDKPISFDDTVDAKAEDDSHVVNPQIFSEDTNKETGKLKDGTISPLPPTPGEYFGEGLDADPKSPVRGHKKVSSRGSRGSLRQAAKEHKVKISDEHFVYEDMVGSNGSHLTSVKPSYDYNQHLKLDQSEAKLHKNNGLQLVAGRKPAAGWNQSA
jgi:hypothetical protein